MPVPLLDLRAQHARIKDDVVRAMMRVVDDQAFILGRPVEELERDVGQLSRTTFAVGCASGTDALLLAFRALDIGRGDEVVTTPFTLIVTFLPTTVMCWVNHSLSFAGGSLTSTMA